MVKLLCGDAMEAAFGAHFASELVGWLHGTRKWALVGLDYEDEGTQQVDDAMKKVIHVQNCVFVAFGNPIPLA